MCKNVIHFSNFVTLLWLDYDRNSFFQISPHIEVHTVRLDTVISLNPFNEAIRGINIQRDFKICSTFKNFILAPRLYTFTVNEATLCRIISSAHTITSA